MQKDNKKAPAEFGDQTGAAKRQDGLYNLDDDLAKFGDMVSSKSLDGISPKPPQPQPQSQPQKQTDPNDAPDPHSPDVFAGLTPQQRYDKIMASGRGLKDSKFRNWAIVVYPDSAYPDWRQRLEDLHLPGFISPEHNKDKKTNGNPDKPHYHVLFHFSAPVPYKDLVDIDIEFAGIYGAVVPERVRDFKGYARYLCHLDNKDKVKYNPDDVQAMGDMDYSLYSISKRDEQLQTMITLKDVATFIKANKITNFFDLFDMAQQVTCDDDYELLKMIVNKTYFVNALVTGNYQKVNSDIAQKEKEINDEYNNLKSRNQYRQAEREQLFARIEALEAENEALKGARM